MNFIHIAGHLGADPETRFTQSGKKVTTLRVAARARKGTNNDETIWWRVTIWGDQFDKLVPHLKKGSGVMVFGEMQKPEIFNDREGKPQASMDITAMQITFSPFGKPGGAQGGQENHGAANNAGPAASFGSMQESAPNPYMGGKAPAGQAQGQGSTFDDEVPF